MSAKKILVFYPYNPFTKAHGVHARFIQLFKYMKSRGFTIDMLTHKNYGDPWDDVMVMSHDIEKMIDNLHINDVKVSQRKETGFFQKIINWIFFKGIRGTEITDLDTFPDFAYKNLQNQFNQIIKQTQYDIVLVTYPMWANLVKKLDKKITRIMTIEDFMSLNYFDKSDGRINVGNYISEEIKRTNYFDKIICISKDEKVFFERFCRNPEFYHIPHMMPLKAVDESIRKKIDLLYVGSNNQFNRDGMIWFFEKIVPLLNPQYKLTVIGKVNEHLGKYKKMYNQFDFINFAEELDPYYQSSKLTICPMFGGTGLKIKVVESLSFAIPCVTTPYGVIGMEQSNKNGCVVTDNAELYAMHIRDLLEDDSYRNMKSKEAYQFFRKNYTEEKMFYKLDDVFLNKNKYEDD